MTSDPHRCVDCVHFDLRAAGSLARLGMGRCKAADLPPGVFVTDGYPRACLKFESASPDVVAKRAAFLAGPPLQPLENS